MGKRKSPSDKRRQKQKALRRLEEEGPPVRIDTLAEQFGVDVGTVQEIADKRRAVRAVDLTTGYTFVAPWIEEHLERLVMPRLKIVGKSPAQTEGDSIHPQEGV